MSTVSIDNNITALLAAAGADFANAEANTGQGYQGEWPPEGPCDLFITGTKETIGEFKETFKGGRDPKKVACVEITFDYDTIPSDKDPNFRPGTAPLHFSGERFQLVPNYEKVLEQENTKTRARINWDRFKGHLSKILGVPETSLDNPLAAYQQVKAKTSGDSRIAVRAMIQYRPDNNNKNKVYKTEFITANISN